MTRTVLLLFLIVLNVILGLSLFNIVSDKRANQKIQKKYNVQNFKLKSGGLDREYFVYKPQNSMDNLPVVIALHGGGGPIGSAEFMIERSGWVEKAAKEHFIAVFPQGTIDDPKKPINLDGNIMGNGYNILTWSDGSLQKSSSIKGVDDVSFIKSVLEDVGRRFSVDKSRIFVTGFSNGATMSYYLGVELSDKLAAIAPVAGLLYTGKKSLKSPVSLFSIVGSDDRPPANRINFIPKAEASSSVTNPIAKWQEYLSCPSDTNVVDNKISRITSYGPCVKGSGIVNYMIKNLGHVYPGLSSFFGADPKIGDKINAADLIWDFFKKHPKPPDV